MSDFIESVDDMIARHFASWALITLRDKPVTEDALYGLIRSSITHARNQTNGRRTGFMTFEEAMQLISSQPVIATRHCWNIFRGVRQYKAYPDGDDYIDDFILDNCDGDWGGSGHPYHPTDEDRSATDWMLYQPPQENWVELQL